MRLDSHTNACPRCRGCLPDEGPPSQVCCCGTNWGPDLRELIRLLDEVLSDPPPPDPFPVPEDEPKALPTPAPKISEETRND